MATRGTREVKAPLIDAFDLSATATIEDVAAAFDAWADAYDDDTSAHTLSVLEPDPIETREQVRARMRACGYL